MITRWLTVLALLAGLGLLVSPTSPTEVELAWAEQSTTPPTPPPATTTPSPTPPSVGQSPKSSCDWQDPGSWGLDCVTPSVGGSINDWFRDLVTSGLHAALEELADQLLSTTDLTTVAPIVTGWEVSRSIVDTSLVLIVLIAGILIMSGGAFSSRLSARDVVPRLLIAVVAINMSLTVVSTGISVSNALARGVLSPGTTPQQLVATLDKQVVGQMADAGIFVLLLGLVMAVLMLVLLLVWVIRLMITGVLIVAAPLVLAGHALPVSEGLAKWWWRSLFSVLAIQVVQSLVLIVGLSTFVSSGYVINNPGGNDELMPILILLVLLWLEIKVPWSLLQGVWGQGRSTVISLVKLAAFGSVTGTFGMRGGGLLGLASRSRHSVANSPSARPNSAAGNRKPSGNKPAPSKPKRQRPTSRTRSAGHPFTPFVERSDAGWEDVAGTPNPASGKRPATTRRVPFTPQSGARVPRASKPAPPIETQRPMSSKGEGRGRTRG
ncbi:hypothetical protein D5S17_14565 [Pseudonocardiaceae bacterium YIM PH 21723]|nr:hypothetical protein D5S17_14565 [Pseudonocardiaceae bacterium YIM PH 21723]